LIILIMFAEEYKLWSSSLCCLMFKQNIHWCLHKIPLLASIMSFETSELAFPPIFYMHSASRLLKVNYCVYKNVQLGPIARQSYSRNSFMPYFTENHYNIVPILFWQDDTKSNSL
jgi:hypothetical protein